MAPRRLKKGFFIDNAVTLGMGLLALIGGGMVQFYTIATNVATRPYVDESFKNARLYTDEKSAQTLKEAYAHADSNMNENRLRMEQYHAEMKQIGAAQGAKIESIFDLVKRINEDTSHRRK